MQLKDICILDVACCTRETTIIAAARMMRQLHTGDLIVIDDSHERIPAGIITDRDIVIEVLGQGRDPTKTTVADVMTTQLVIASDSEEVSQALERMRAHGVRRVPVVGEGGRVVGIVTLDDMLKLHAEQASGLLDVIVKEQNREGRARR